MRFIDLRSDTVTMPTDAMRRAMANAVVGDDVFDDDPTVKELEKLAAEKLGKESALFVSSGTQGNAVCLMAHTRRGDAVILGRGSHIAGHEAGSYAMLAGVSPCFAEDSGGILSPESVAEKISDDSDLQTARTGLVCIENALSNGNVAPVENFKRIYAIAKEKGVPVHLDGARIYNAAAYLGVDVKELTQYSDSVLCCLSKGLCAPVGSVIAGSAGFIARAKKLRKALGGGMRQVGVLAAAGIISLDEMTKRVHEDNENAKYLAEKLDEINGVHVDIDAVKINIIFFKTDWAPQAAARFKESMLAHRIKTTSGSYGEYRFVTNNDVTREDCDAVIRAVREFSAEAGM